MDEAVLSEGAGASVHRDVCVGWRRGAEVDRDGVVHTEANVSTEGHRLVGEGKAVAVRDDLARRRLRCGAMIRDDGLGDAYSSKGGPGREDGRESEVHGVWRWTQEEGRERERSGRLYNGRTSHAVFAPSSGVRFEEWRWHIISQMCRHSARICTQGVSLKLDCADRCLVRESTARTNGLFGIEEERRRRTLGDGRLCVIEKLPLWRKFFDGLPPHHRYARLDVVGCQHLGIEGASKRMH